MSFWSRFSQVKLFVSRLKNDWDKLPCKMRKVFVWKDAVSLHAVCGAYLSLLSDLQGRVPRNDFVEAVPLLQSQFDLGYLDPEIENMLLQPPPAPGDVPFFRTKGCCVCQILFSFFKVLLYVLCSFGLATSRLWFAIFLAIDKR